LLKINKTALDINLEGDGSFAGFAKTSQRRD